MLVAGGAGGVVAAEGRAADGDAGGIDVGALREPIDAATDRDFVIEARGDVVTAERAPLPRTVDHQDRDAPLQRPVRLHEPHLVLDAVEPAHRNEHRLAGNREGRADEIGAEPDAVLVGDFDDFAGRIEPAQEFPRAGLHRLEGGKPAGIARGQPELRLAVIISRPQPAILRRANMPDGGFRIAAAIIPLGDAQPLDVPALLVARNHPRGRLEALADCAAAFLRLPQPAPELIRHPRMQRPLLPAIRLVVRRDIRGGGVNELLFHAFRASLSFAGGELSRHVSVMQVAFLCRKSLACCNRGSGGSPGGRKETS